MKINSELIIEYGDYFIENLGFMRTVSYTWGYKGWYNIEESEMYTYGMKKNEDEIHLDRYTFVIREVDGKWVFLISSAIYLNIKEIEINFNETKENNLKMLLLVLEL